MKLSLLLTISLSVLVAACEDPAANKPKATTSEPSINKPASSVNTTASSAKGETLAITSTNSTVQFVGSKVTGKHDGGFTMFTGTIDLINGKPEGSSVSVDIETASAFADDAKLTEHLKSAEFFDVQKYPKATFKSTSIVLTGGTGDNYDVSGDLELHGQIKSIKFPTKINVTDDLVTVNAGFSINRKDFGIIYAGKADDLIRDDVVLQLDLKTPRKK